MAVTGFSKVKKVGGGAKKTTTHPPYAQMIKEAIASLKERSGSSQFAIAKFIEDKHKVQNLSPNFKKLVSSQLKKLAANGTLIKVKSSFKLGAPAKPKVPSKKATKTKPKKPKTAAAKPKKPKTNASKPKKPKKPKTIAEKPKTNAAKPKMAKKVATPGVMKAKKVVMKTKKAKSVKSPGKKKVVATKKAKK